MLAREPLNRPAQRANAQVAACTRAAMPIWSMVCTHPLARISHAHARRGVLKPRAGSHTAITVHFGSGLSAHAATHFMLCLYSLSDTISPSHLRS